jgi:protein gp37
MGDVTKIEWADSTFNAWMGCQKISAGCDNCYADILCGRYGHATFGPGEQRNRTSEGNWKKPVSWNRNATAFQAANGRRQRVFCSSLSDVFDNAAPAQWRADLFELIKATPELDWLLLTKRPTNIRKMLPPDWGDGYPNVWLGTTTEDQDAYDKRWHVVAGIPARVRFLSYEPAIGPLKLADGPQPDWIISGGESGPGARTMQPAWARSIRDQCAAHGIAFLHKQWGSYASNPLMAEQGIVLKVAKTMADAEGKGGAMIDGVLHREWPVAA